MKNLHIPAWFKPESNGRLLLTLWSGVPKYMALHLSEREVDLASERKSDRRSTRITESKITSRSGENTTDNPDMLQARVERAAPAGRFPNQISSAELGDSAVSREVRGMVNGSTRENGGYLVWPVKGIQSLNGSSPNVGAASPLLNCASTRPIAQ
ncbi:hypothetical protein B0H17DRAFT_1146584 [Mycena rosella]|uniref:Uncharacterized protein n=1 Tax=Mycena rosella TaxID=1033263 RepID=A0AAD7CNL2_MYCRO|nr:hypothetical protein B0H17DRAFT_1146584 [Mycena rosella]